MGSSNIKISDSSASLWETDYYDLKVCGGTLFKIWGYVNLPLLSPHPCQPLTKPSVCLGGSWGLRHCLVPCLFLATNPLPLCMLVRGQHPRTDQLPTLQMECDQNEDLYWTPFKPPMPLSSIRMSWTTSTWRLNPTPTLFIFPPPEA